VAVGSGNSADADSGDVAVGSGDAGNDSGDVVLSTGTAGGTKGKIRAQDNVIVEDDTQVQYGDDVNGHSEFVSGSNRLDHVTEDATAGGADPATAAMQVQTGDRHLNDAAGSPASGALNVLTGDSVVDNGAGAATGGNSGDLEARSGDTNCDDAAGTAGNSGAASFGSGDADSNAGTSGDSGPVTVSSGFSDDADSGDVLIESGSAANAAGDVILRGGAGGVTNGATVVQDPTDNTKELELDADGITTGNRRTLAMADADVDLAVNLIRSKIVNVPYTAFTAAAQSETINVGAALPADAIGIGAKIDLNTEFNSPGGGGDATQSDVELGNAGDDNRFMTATDVWQAAGLGDKILTPGVAFDGTESVAPCNATQVQLTMTVGVGETVDTFNAGDLDVHFYYVVPLAGG